MPCEIAAEITYGSARTASNNNETKNTLGKGRESCQSIVNSFRVDDSFGNYHGERGAV